ncbi:hypothetical protein CIPAW_15G169400 [Carya illinoinensis]|uniref:TIR domain-containing protein n=2 Tax=Carya illinoinensis TaxID=32201 RepID=A0A8T1NFX7_CARIL|nr:hypothetical protein CIPAW_15G169400 [Carya illinoinensis]
MSSSMAFQLGASSSFSCPSIHSWNHDVFLSFKGKDVRHNFISHLNRALRQSGIKTYMDGVDLERGEQISSELFKAIEESQILIVVLSKNYAEFRWCLDELLKILECKKIKKQIVLPIFYKVKPSEVREQKGRFGEAFIKLGKKIKDAKKSLLESWKEALEEVVNLSGLEYLAIEDDESEFIQKIIMWVNPKIVKRMPLSVAKHPIGIESRIRDIYQCLRIFGTGGIGKTTITNDIYNQISSQFEGSCFLRNIRETSKQILGTKLDINDVDRGIGVIWHRLQSKRILLILDDVDEMVQLENLAGDRAWFGSGNNSKVDLKYEVRTLNKKEPLKDFVDLSKQVTKYAQGLPLALTVLGSDLKGRSIHQWKSALDKYKSIPNQNIQRILQISYDSLEDSEKDMFLDIAFSFKGKPLANVMEIFDSCDFFPAHGIQRLIDKCLITIIPKNFGNVWMHDLLHDMGREIERQKSSKDPSKRNRLWFQEDVREVLEEDTNLTTMAFETCSYLTEISDLSSTPNLKELTVKYCRRLVKVHDSVGSLEYLSKLDCEGCSKLRILPRSLNLRDLPEIKCKMECLCHLSLPGTAIEELPLSIENLVGLETLYLQDCKNLMRLPIALIQLQHLWRLGIGGCTNIVKKMKDDGQSLDLPNDSTIMEDEISNSRNGSNALQLSNLQISCSHSESIFFPLCSFFTMFNSSTNLDVLDLSETDIVSLPTSIKEFVTLTDLLLISCHKLEEIAELPPNIRKVNVLGCKSLERFSEV